MKKFIVITLTSLLFSTQIIAGFHASLGFDTITYKEDHQFQPTLSTNISQMAPRFNFGIKSYLLSFIYAGADVFYVGPAIGTSNKKVRFLLGDGYIGLVIPAKPIDISIVADYVYNSVSTTDNTFGYKSLSALNYSGVLQYDSPKKSIHFEAKIPFYTGIKDLKMLDAKIALNFNRSTKTRWVFAINYHKFELPIPGILTTNIFTESIGFNLGFHW